MLPSTGEGRDAPASHTQAAVKLQFDYSATLITQKICSQSKLEKGGKNFPVTFLHIAGHHNSKENFA